MHWPNFALAQSQTRFQADARLRHGPRGWQPAPPLPRYIGECPLRHVLKVWRDPSDRISALRIFTLMCLFAPLSKAIYDSDSIMLDARPITNLIHRTGDWALT